MTALAEIVIAEASSGRLPPEKPVSRFTPEQIRQNVAHLVSTEQLPLANALVDAGLSLYPDSEDILSIGALVAQVLQDWDRAKELLRSLMRVQKGFSPPQTWFHWVRVLRCRGEIKNATLAAKQASGLFPNDEQLQKEYLELVDLTENATQLDTAATRQ
jgi:hypothetical protein